MAEKCENCDGVGFFLGGNAMWTCGICRRYTAAEARDRIHLCCEAHDELVAALKELLTVHIWDHGGDDSERVVSAVKQARSVFRKLNSVKEPSTT